MQSASGRECRRTSRSEGQFFVEYVIYFLDKKLLRIFSLPRSAILIHKTVDMSAGRKFLYFSNSTDTIPSPLTTIGIITHSQFHIRPSSILNPLYLVIFSCSFWVTLISLGQDTSMIKHFLFSMSRTTISGRLNTYGLSVEMGMSHNISTFFNAITSGGLWVCHLEHV